MRKPSHSRQRRSSSTNAAQARTFGSPVPQQLAEDDLRPPTGRLRLHLGPSQQPFGEDGVGNEVANAGAWGDGLGESVHTNNATLDIVLEEGGHERGLELLGGLSDESRGSAEVVLRELEEGVGVILDNDHVCIIWECP